MPLDRLIYIIILMPITAYLLAWAGVYAWKVGRTLLLLLQEADQERRNAREWRRIRGLPR